MLRNSDSAQPDLPPQHHPGSAHHIPEDDHGYQQSPRQHERTSTTPPRRENAFNAPRPSLLPYQEYHSGFTDDDLPSSPISSSYSHHRRQTSFSNLLPLAIRNRTPSPTRRPSILAAQQEMPLTGDGRTRSRPGTPASKSSPRGGGGGGGFAGWLSGTAAGNALDSLSSPRPNSRGTPDGTPTRLFRNITQTVMPPNYPSTPTESVSTRATRFMTALSTVLAPSSSPPPPNRSLEDDELYNLDIESALFPPHSPTDSRDAFSPAAFKNLQANAVGLLGKFQAAYRAKAQAARDLEAERGAQRDEIEEAVTRAAHLKFQLEGMAHRAAEQETAMRQLVGELVAEKHAREEERLVRERAAAGAVVAPAGSMVSEDLGVDEEWRVGKRKSGGSGESWGETDEESVDESVFSRCRSPAAVEEAGSGTVRVKSGSGTVRARNGGAQLSAFQKIFKNIAGDMEEVNGCRNCQGKNASAAWDTVSLLRDENKHLKQRVGQLEVAVEGALDMVNGLGL
ncbi:hypothetical protein CONLIGDRAFT_652311 [Coniochaeta ligniaria NRRL 30616]|uniref:Uncharacterized protein n=1 Tax=Coniochaeta ligniaria NRRL 30616 TaxID=1408157 RepID=A0A1J7J2B1_9PEZI|nr:hypothetical protein CONLIGDRAFT_652311 [Coniochaeta ligniaria NRRL 30616]